MSDNPSKGAIINFDVEHTSTVQADLSFDTKVTIAECSKNCQLQYKFRVDILDDLIDEPRESFNLSIASASGLIFSGQGEVSGITIAEDSKDSSPALSISKSSTVNNVSEDSNTPVIFTFSLDKESGRKVTVNYNISGYGITDKDYKVSSPSLVFYAGETSKNLAITPVDDWVKEPAETLIVSASSASHADISGTGSASFTIDEDKADYLNEVATPAQVTRVNAQIDKTSDIIIDWSELANNLTSYNLYYAKESLAALNNVSRDFATLKGGSRVTEIKNNTYRLSSVDLSSTYYFVVTGVNFINGAMKESTPSAEAFVFRKEPLEKYQWYIFNDGSPESAAFAFNKTGTNHMNIAKVHNELDIRGRGVVVNVIDTGLEVSHEDLSVDVARSFDYLEKDRNPQPIGTGGDHGTSIAGIIAMKRNGKGGVGVAPSATVLGHAYIERVSSVTVLEYGDMHGISRTGTASEIAAIYNRSFTSKPIKNALASDYKLKEEILKSGGKFGRSGKGYIYVSAAGNSFYGGHSTDLTADCESPASAYYGQISCHSAAEHVENTYPENIVVSATNASAMLSSYSSTGASVWVSATGGEYGYGDLGNAVRDAKGRLQWQGVFSTTSPKLKPAMVTADVQGCSVGYSVRQDVTGQAPKNKFEYDLALSGGQIKWLASALNSQCSYTSTFNGTSSATAVLSGIIALMLEANPRLTWRDVKHILANTAKKVNPAKTNVVLLGSNPQLVIESSGWNMNAASYAFSNWYGFGQPDAYAAVQKAKEVDALGLWPKLVRYTGLNNTSVDFSDNSITNFASSAITISGSGTFVEHVRVVVDSIKGSDPQDLLITLESPQGTRNVLFAPKQEIRPYSGTSSFQDFALSSNAFYGEDVNGTWVLRVYDIGTKSTGSDGKLSAWRLEVAGH